MCSAVVLASCGGGGEKEQQQADPGPQIERAVADRLAALSDQVGDRLHAQDNCGAAGSASDLTAAAVAAVNERKIPAAYLEDFLGAVNELEAQIPQCEQAPPDDDGGEDDDRGSRRDDEKGNGKGKGRDKKGDD